ncbi:proprotein convertase subtilisin/kexin type 5-like [Rhinophrynus dorsalis]
MMQIIQTSNGKKIRTLTWIFQDRCLVAHNRSNGLWGQMVLVLPTQTVPRLPPTENRYWYEGVCYASCPENTYNDDLQKICLECDTDCFSCTENECLLCEDGFFLLDGVCVTDCGPGFYADDIDNECDTCFRTCESCHGPDYDECTACKEGFHLEKAICVNSAKSQPPGTFWNGTFLYRQSCVKSCPRGTILNERDKRCEICTAGCEICSDSTACLKCSHEFLHQGRCYRTCPDGFFGFDGSCIECSKDCKTCKDNSDYCLSCHAPKLLEQAKCKTACSVRYTAIDGVCRHCSPDCKACVDKDTCTECMPGYFLHERRCLNYCPDGYYSSVGTCQLCDPMCAKCSGPDPDDCEECSSKSFFLYNGECFGRCPKGTYYEANTQNCQDCDTSCKLCSSSTYCDECREDLVKNSQGQCVSHKECSLYEYQDEHGGCRPCHKKCSRCMGATEHHCLSCLDSHYLLNSTCVDKCADGYYTEEEERHCVPCHSTCLTCSGKRSTHCLSCKAGWYSQGGTCVQTCITGHYSDNSSSACEKCHKSCEECSGPESTDCLYCHKNFFLMRTKKQCFSSCPEYYYEDNAKRTCERCHPTCKTCTGFGALSCTSCVWSYQLFGSICQSKCLAGEFIVKEDPELQCDKCHDSCVECKGAGPFNCTDCPASFVLYVDEGRCVHCCNSKSLSSGECCDCAESLDECILMKGLSVESDGKKKTALFITTSILLVLSIGAILFYWRRSRAKALSVKKAGYEKLPDQTKSFQSFKSRESTSSFQRDQVIEYHDREEEEEDDEDDDIVYMGQDGTVYRKFKYGLLEDEEEDDLEYDDESYSYR